MMLIDQPLSATCLFLDVDGSLIDIAPRPNDVVVPENLVGDLDRAARVLGGALALVSGRTIAQLDRLFAPVRFRASGVHGAETRYEPDGPILGSQADAISRDIWDDLLDLTLGYPGTIIEDKAFSFAVHYRAVPAVAEPLARDLGALLGRYPEAGLRLMPGHFVIEIKPSTFDKGIAVRRFLGQPRFAGRTPIFIGDDVTDYPGFAAAVESGGRAFGVSRDIPGTTGTFANPSAVRQWVADVAATEKVHA